mmetsp:Transcript_37123/g.109490  ORF Transcript_37123/g.109490 Transcript_37123/m.109490 type:complete len:106 (-) Transcript_37123:632-949(-)
MQPPKAMPPKAMQLQPHQAKPPKVRPMQPHEVRLRSSRARRCQPLRIARLRCPLHELRPHAMRLRLAACHAWAPAAGPEAVVAAAEAHMRLLGSAQAARLRCPHT